MFTRKRFTWKCIILDPASGKQLERDFTSFWSPEKMRSDEIAAACASREAGIVNHGTKPFVPVSAQLVA